MDERLLTTHGVSGCSLVDERLVTYIGDEWRLTSIGKAYAEAVLLTRENNAYISLIPVTFIISFFMTIITLSF